jgi:protein transport protein SEC13
MPQPNIAGPGQTQGPQQPQPTVMRFASAGCDNLIRIWGYREDSQSWVEEETLEGHTDWVRDVAWAPNIGLPRSYIASASQVKLLIVASQFFFYLLMFFFHFFRTKPC